MSFNIPQWIVDSQPQKQIGLMPSCCDEELLSMNDPAVVWRCPCVGIPECDSLKFPLIELLIRHMRVEHSMNIVNHDDEA